MKRAVVFDLDGTLWDTCAPVTEAWNRALARLRVSRRVTVGEIRSLMGKTVPEIGALVFPDNTSAEQAALMDALGEEETAFLARNGGRLFDGLEDALDALSCPCMIVSNCQSGYIEAFLAAHRLETRFADHECSGRTGLSKGENIRLILERNGVGRAIYVGDTASDQAAARYAGLPFVHAAYGFGAVEGADGIIRSLRELPKLAETLFVE